VNSKLRGALGVLLGLALAGPAWAEELDAIEKKVVEQLDKIKSLTSRMAMTQDIKDENMSNKMRSDGTFEYMKKGEKSFFRTDMKMTGETAMKGAEPQKLDGQMQLISDGDVTYIFNEQGPMKMAYKTKADKNMNLVDKDMFKRLKEDHELKVAADADVDGKSCYVVEATPKKPSGPMTKMVYYMQKDSGLTVKTVGQDKDGKELVVTHMSDIKLNVDIPADRFVFKAPEGVTVMDMTGAGGHGGAGGEAPPPAGESPPPPRPAGGGEKPSDGRTPENPVKPKVPDLPKKP
jgi:outer membrane lipoprotein-sorting protein